MADAVEPRVLLPLTHIGFDLPYAREIVVQQRIHRGGRLALEPITAVRCERVTERTADEEGNRHQRQRGERSVRVKHHRCHDGDLQYGYDSTLDAIDQHAL